MQFEVNYKYTQNWIPPRCRKPRPGIFDGVITVEVKEVQATEAPWACVVHGRRRYFDEYPYNPIRYFNGKFYERAMRDIHVKKEFLATDSYGNEYKWKSYDDAQKVKYLRVGMSLDDVVASVKSRLYYTEHYDESRVTSCIIESADEYLIVNGEAWHEVGEPMYEINTFGLGHNHGGTAWFVQDCYNSNLSHKAYFNANDFEAMVESFLNIALGRGDTHDAHRCAKELASGDIWNYIDVCMPEVFTHNPSVEHGDGDPFMNMIHDITMGSDSACEAGLLVMAAAIR